MNGLTGVYVGDGWVLTANHVGTGPLTLDGVTYPAVLNSTVRLEHTPGVFTDLRLYRLVSDPGLTTLPIASVSPALSTEAFLIGRGRDRLDVDDAGAALDVDVGEASRQPEGIGREGEQEVDLEHVPWRSGVLSILDEVDPVQPQARVRHDQRAPDGVAARGTEIAQDRAHRLKVSTRRSPVARMT